MRVAFTSSTENFGFRNTLIVFVVEDGPMEVFREDCSEQLALYLFFTSMVQRCPRNEQLVLLSVPKSATLVVQNIDEHAANGFQRKAYRPELMGLKDLLTTRSVEITCEPIPEETKQRLDDQIALIRKGRLKERPIIQGPGDPEENPWGRSRETLRDLLDRALKKDRHGEG